LASLGRMGERQGKKRKKPHARTREKGGRQCFAGVWENNLHGGGGRDINCAGKRIATSFILFAKGRVTHFLGKRSGVF